VGWAPEGAVYYSYAVNASTTANNFTADAISDIDNNGVTNEWAYVKPIPGTTSALAGRNKCASTGVYDPVSGTTNLLETVGPCDSVSGQSEF
jgi:hypothetical protein